MARFSDSKLVRLVNLLSTKEYNELEDWLKLPQYKTPKKLKNLYLILKKIHEKNNVVFPTKENLYKKIYPGKSYNPNSLNNLIRSFSELIESYLIFSESCNSNTSKYLYFRSLLNRADYDIFHKEIIAHIEKLKAQEAKKGVSPYQLFQLYQLLYSHPAYDQKYSKGSEHIEVQNRYLEDFFLEQKYLLLHEQNIINNIDLSKMEMSALDHLEIFRKNSDSKILVLFEQRFKRKPPLTFLKFDHFYEQFLRYFDSITIEYRRIFLLLCVNDVTRLSVSGQQEKASRYLFKLYKFGMDEQLILTKSMITPIMFNNLITVALQLDEIEFLEEFLWKREDLLPGTWSKDAIIWANAKKAYHLGHLTNVIALDTKYNCKHWLYKLQIRVVLLKTYYDLVEQKDYRPTTLIKYLEAFKTFIVRNKDKYLFRPDAYLLLIHFTGKLYQINEKIKPSISKEYETLKKEIQEAKGLFGRNWLLDKIGKKMVDS